MLRSLISCARPLIIRRSFAKQKKKATSSGHNAGEESSSSSSVATDFDTQVYADKMRVSVDHLRAQFGALRLGKANSALLDHVRVQITKSQSVKLDTLAHVVVKDPQTLHVIAHDEKMISLVDKAVKAAGLNLNPQIQEDNILRVPIPRMSQEYRANLVKQLSQMAESAKNAVRNVRQDARKSLKKVASASTDDVRRCEKDIQTHSEQWCKNVDELVKVKAKEIEG